MNIGSKLSKAITLLNEARQMLGHANCFAEAIEVGEKIVELEALYTRLHAVTVENCFGCEDNFYNGENPLGVKECWHLKSARLEHRVIVPSDLRPPWKMPGQLLPNCYRRHGCVVLSEKQRQDNNDACERSKKEYR
jgi:hypothetical protein